MNSIINTLGGIIRLSFSLATIPMLVRILGVERFGQYSLVNAIINIFTLAEWSIGMTATVFLSAIIETPFKANTEYKNLISSIFIILSLTIFIIVTLTQSKIVILFLLGGNNNIVLDINNLSILIAFNLSLRIIQQFFIGVEQAHLYYKMSNYLITINSLLISVVTILSAYYWHSINRIIFAQSIVIGIFCVIHCLICINREILSFRYFFNFSISHIKIVGLYSLRTWFGAFGGVLFLQGDKIIVNRILGIELTGIYAAFTGITNQINSISALPLQPIVPAISKFIKSEQNKHEIATITNTLSRAFSMNLNIIILLGSTIIMFSPEIIALLNFKQYLFNQELSISLVVISIIYMIYSLNATGYYCLYATGNELYIAVITFLGSIISLALIAALSEKFGLIGSFLGNSGFLITLLFVRKASKILHIDIKYIIKDQMYALLICIFPLIAHSVNLNLDLRIVIQLCLVIVSLMWMYREINIFEIFSKNFNSK